MRPMIIGILDLFYVICQSYKEQQGDTSVQLSPELDNWSRKSRTLCLTMYAVIYLPLGGLRTYTVRQCLVQSKPL